ncbi:hypothetical protein [Hymenobacter crusticola]|uniref:Uncharacterized protein n=1 Tax=Hymenobacter crusticola TaxID=1770526 RepID=A0A243W569_9BACT|nr:hypothetical protein [Hymenobacter crusticola]OUJ67841.1 hypothetical protein BXP70_28460 [Hymenobacter crusticola]
MTSPKTLAEYILQEETRSKQVKLGARRSHDYDLTRDLEIIAEDFQQTAFGKVVVAEGLTVEALYTHREGVEGWSGLVFTLQEGISYYLPLTFDEQKYGSEVRSVSLHAWPAWLEEATALLRWVSRARKMLAEDVWIGLDSQQ